jgi:SH3 domain protein
MTNYTINRIVGQTVRIFCLTLLLIFFSPSLGDPATTLYVSDTTLEANLRTGTGSENRIIGLLRPGTEVTLLSEENGWAEVTLQDGRTGWILRRYLSERPPWKVTAESLQQENQKLSVQLAKLRTEHRQLTQENIELKKQVNSQQREMQNLEHDYEELKNSSTTYLNLKMAYENLQDEARKSKARLDQVEKSYRKLKTSTAIRWFLSGAGVLILGWILGSSMARVRRRRSTDYYKL